jgi:O-antigen/teichoic acid export membrane protein
LKNEFDWEKTMSVGKKSAQAIAWNSISNIIRVLFLAFRSIFLARFLAIDIFGIYTFSASIISITAFLLDFGMDGAFVHKASNVKEENIAANTYFTLSCIFAIIWGALMGIGAWIWLDGNKRTVLLILIPITIVKQFTRPPRMILTRRVEHRRLAFLQAFNVVIGSVVAVFLAWYTGNVWALLSVELISSFTAIIILYVWRPVWKPNLVWSPEYVKYFLQFGNQNLFANLLSSAIKRVDDLWTGLVLGDTALGFYSRAYTFASYPANILGTPVNEVAIGTYAALKMDRLGLSQAFYRMNALLIRSGFLLAGLLGWTAPELIRIGIGSQWLPMLVPFRFLLIFALLDPIKITIANLFIALGQPKLLVKVRLVQFVILGIGLLILGPLFEITGVAIAADIMMVSGIGLMIIKARTFVDISLRKMFQGPILGLIISSGITWGILLAVPANFGDWVIIAIKTLIFTLTYGIVLFLLEPGEVRKAYQMVKEYFPLPWPSRGA